MKKFFALLAVVASIFAVSCEGGFDLSDLLRPYLPDPVVGEAILEVDEDGNYIVSPEGGELNVDLSVVQQYLEMDLVSQVMFEISEEGKDWIYISSIEEITNGTLIIDVDANTTDQKRYADIVLRPVENEFLNYTINLVQMPAGYVHVEKTLTLKADKSSVKVNDVVTFTVTNKSGEDVTSASTIYLNDEALEGNTFQTDKSGSYKFHAAMGEELSKSITVKVSKK